MIALDCANMEIVGERCEFFEVHPDEFGIVAQFHTYYYKESVAQFKPVSHPVAAQGDSHLLGGEILGINEVIYSEFLEKHPIFLF